MVGALEIIDMAVRPTPKIETGADVFKPAFFATARQHDGATDPLQQSAEGGLITGYEPRRSDAATAQCGTVLPLQPV